MCQRPRLSRPRCNLSKHCTPGRVSRGPGLGLLRIMLSRPLCSSHSHLLALRRSRIPPRNQTGRLPHLHHQAKETSRSSRTLVLLGVAAACAVLTLFSARGLRAAGRTPCRLLVSTGSLRLLSEAAWPVSACPQNPRTRACVHSVIAVSAAYGAMSQLTEAISQPGIYLHPWLPLGTVPALGLLLVKVGHLQPTGATHTPRSPTWRAC